MDEQNRIAAQAARRGELRRLNAASGQGPSLPADPLRRLEVELGQAGEGSGDERLYEEAQGLVEEAWSLVTECLVLRDGLLDACHEIEQTMNGIHERLDALPAAIERDGHERGVANGDRTAMDGPRTAVSGLDGVGPDRVVGVNGVGAHDNGSNGTGSNGAVAH
jgi:hypothetical protein